MMIDKNTPYPVLAILKEYQDRVESDLSKQYIYQIFNLIKANILYKKEIDSLEIIIENFEESVYRPNDPSSRFFKPKHVFNFRIEMIKDFNYHIKNLYNV